MNCIQFFLALSDLAPKELDDLNTSKNWESIPDFSLVNDGTHGLIVLGCGEIF